MDDAALVSALGEGYHLNARENRAAAREQPPALERRCLTKGRERIRWHCMALVAKRLTGKAKGWLLEKAGAFAANSKEEVLAARDEFIASYMNPREPPKGSRPSIPLPARESSKRQARPDNLMEGRHPSGGKRRAGPGRGHVNEAAAFLPNLPAEEEEPLPSCVMPGDGATSTASSNWLQQLSMKTQWQTRRMRDQDARIKDLEIKLAVQDAKIQQQDETIQRLRERVASLEEQLRLAAQEIVSFIESEPMLKQTSHAQKLEDNPEWGLILGLGYNTSAQKQSLVYKHLRKLVDSLRVITAGDALKAKQLAEMLFMRMHSGEKRRQGKMSKLVEHSRDVSEAIAESVRSFVLALHDAGGTGRYPNKVRQAMQVIATSVCKAAVYSKTHTTIKEIGDALGLNPRLISECRARFDSLTDSDWESIFDDRSAIRSDKLPEEWIEFATEFWTEPDLTDENNEAYNFTRRAESASKVVRNPDDRKSRETHRVHWLEERVQLIYAAMLKRGAQVFGGSFHFSWPSFLELRPYYVKDATRETCMCIYHMRFDEMATGLLTYRRTLRQQNISTCKCEIPKNSRSLRKLLVCPKDDADANGSASGEACSRLDNIECILQNCTKCQDLVRLTSGPCSLCVDEMRDPGDPAGPALMVKFESYEKINYTTKDGLEKVKKDFVSTELPFSEFKNKLAEFWPKFIAHHNDAKWLDDDFVSMRTHLPRGHVAFVIDFAENYSHEPRFEHQSKYFTQVQTTIVPVVIMLRVEDVNNISSDERDELLALFAKLELPNVISETHFVISSDMQHDNAFIQKALDDHIIPYIMRVSTDVKCIHVRSDGCKAQFKCAANFQWISRQKLEGCRVPVNWTFFESCHGKCYCDPEGGALKSAARRFELTLSDKSKQLRCSESLFKWASEESELSCPRAPLAHKKGRGIYRRFFYWIPAKGTGAVDRSRLPKLTAEGTSRLHEFIDIGVSGVVSTRRGACHRCGACWELGRGECAHSAYVGQPRELRIQRENVPSAAAQRIDRAQMDRKAIELAQRAKRGSIVCLETHKEEQNHPWVLGEVMQEVKTAQAASRPFDSQQDPVHFDAVRVNDLVLNIRLYQALEPGSATYFASEFVLSAPARRVRVIEVKMLETRSSSRLVHARRQFKLDPDSLSAIRAEMPAADDDFEVEKVMEYRCMYGTEQWLVKWKNFGLDRNSWEPWDNLVTEEVRAEANSVREASVPRSVEGIGKLTTVTLKAVLSHRGLATDGAKATLVARVHATLCM